MICVRQLYGVPMPKFERDLTKPAINGTEYDWETLYYRYIARMTPQQAPKRSEYWRLAKMMNTKPDEVCHWYTMSTETSMQDKIIVARIFKKKGKERLYVPMFRENHYTFTTIKVYFLGGDPLTW